MQVLVTPGKKGKVTTEEMSLVEVGPRVSAAHQDLCRQLWRPRTLRESGLCFTQQGVRCIRHTISSTAFLQLKHAEQRSLLFGKERRHTMFCVLAYTLIKSVR